MATNMPMDSGYASRKMRILNKLTHKMVRRE